MNWKQTVVTILMCALVVLIGSTPQEAIAEGSSITPRYTYTCEVMAGLEISSSGTATCRGRIQVYSSTSHIAMRVNLYRKEGSSWIKEVGWTDSCDGRYALSIIQTYAVSAGTYKVVTTAAITGADGNYETVSEESNIFSYP